MEKERLYKNAKGVIKLSKTALYVDINKPYAVSWFIKGFEEILLRTIDRDCSHIVILCIGTDRSTGDCLGPLVGHKLRYIQGEYIRVYGTLNEPVHAKNLKATIKKIEERYENPFIISIDACLGKPESIGCISIGEGPIKPGAGVNKKLPEIGHMHVMGIVNISGFMEYMILQNTRLSLVMKMADIISAGIYYNLSKLVSRKLKPAATKK